MGRWKEGRKEEGRTEGRKEMEKTEYRYIASFSEPNFTFKYIFIY